MMRFALCLAFLSCAWAATNEQSAKMDATIVATSVCKELSLVTSIPLQKDYLVAHGEELPRPVPDKQQRQGGANEAILPVPIIIERREGRGERIRR